jgi:hypothetical protein
MPPTHPVNLFGTVPDNNPTYGIIIAEGLGKWEFQLYPQLWIDPQLDLVSNITWTKVKFERPSVADWQAIPIGPGVYFFTVEGRIDLLESHKYLFYVGKAESGLRRRFKNYLHEQEGEEPEEDRTKITKFLNYFRDRVFFHFAELPKDQVVAIESAIKDNLTPPANTVLKLKGRLYK